jgi:hypothetical protein
MILSSGTLQSLDKFFGKDFDNRWGKRPFEDISSILENKRNYYLEKSLVQVSLEIQLCYIKATIQEKLNFIFCVAFNNTNVNTVSWKLRNWYIRFNEMTVVRNSWYFEAGNYYLLSIKKL